MFPPDPAAIRGRPSVCLVAGDGPGRDELTTAANLSAAGWRVHVLFCGSAPPTACAAGLRQAGVSFSHLDAWPPPAEFGVGNVHGVCPSDHSDRVRHALVQLHARQPFDLVRFPALGGLAFRAVQARAAGLAFAGVGFCVRLDASAAWVRACRHAWPAGPEDLQLDFIERYAFENADFHAAPDQAVLEHAGAIGWDVPPGVLVGEPKVEDYARWLGQAAGPVEDDLPLVSVCVPHFNLGRCLGETLASLAGQTYPRLEVLVIDDGSTDPASRAVFAHMQGRYPGFRFETQANAGIGATRNRGLREARGTYFVPMDADNVARPHMVERLVRAIHHRPELGAATCYFLAFRDTADIENGAYSYACRPTGGPHVLASLRNVYGDAAAIYRTSAFRAAGGYETDRDTSFEDWEAFVKLVNAGWGIDVVPEHLFYYRHLESGFSRTTSGHRNRQRVLRQFKRMSGLSQAEGVLLWEALAGFHRRLEVLEARQKRLPYRIVDALGALCKRVGHAVRGRKPAEERVEKGNQTCPPAAATSMVSGSVVLGPCNREEPHARV